MMNSSFENSVSRSRNCDVLRQKFVSLYPVDLWKSEGFFDDTDLLDINCHWLQFEPIKPTAHLALAIIYISLFVVGVVSNALVIFILTSSRKTLLTPANILLLNLAFSDLMILAMVPIFIYNSFLRGPAAGIIGCSVYGFVSGWSGTSSIMSLTAVALDRYLVISRPLDLAKKPTRFRAYVTVLFIWIYSAVFASMPLFGFGKFVPEGYLTSCSFDYLSDDVGTRIFILVFFIAAWLVPLSVIAYCYSAIISAVYHVRRSLIIRTELKDSTKSANKEQTQQTIIPSHLKGVNQPVEMLVAKTVISLIVIWILAWTPYAVVTVIGISGYANYLLTPFNAMLPALFAKSAACIDPFIYSLNHPKIRQEIMRRLYNISMFMMNDQRTVNSFHSTNKNRKNYNVNQHFRGGKERHTTPKEMKCFKYSNELPQSHEIDFSHNRKICTKHHLSDYSSGIIISLEERKQPSENSSTSSNHNDTNREDSKVIVLAEFNLKQQERKNDEELHFEEPKNLMTSEL